MKLVFSIVLFVLSASLFAQKAADVEGLWLVEDEDAYIRIFEKDEKYYGVVNWLENPYDDDGNPVSDPDGKPILEMEIMKDFAFEDGEWVDGTVYDAENGKTYYGSMEMSDINTIKLRGSLDSFGLLGRSETWTRLNEKRDKH